MYQDKVLTCKECGVEFIFSASEQAFFAEKGFTNQPGRCHACRAARKATSGGYQGSSHHSDREMYPVVCSSCGKETTVPFKPRLDKPVYCRDCFQPRPRW
ncbi:zinc-binding protein [Heliobacterium undosum]|uniref:Zinc-binding protein n=1 Tax=Heliomicrobium undosum TaxID=121734 RepID=A0A845L1A8_9FIRM|nr:zinc-ribbon domain containing protein [Heliomicrobium undosum]MZP28749.1 zinc-binding protein [Heliomicrobium undosum]